MHIPYTSKELFHFVGHNHPLDDDSNFRILKRILSDACVSYPPFDRDWGAVSYTINWEESLLSENLICPTVTCYADIPWDSLGPHIRKYGKLGLSFRKSRLIQYGARPVTYIPTGPNDWAGISGKTLLKDVEAVFKGYYNLVSSTLPDSDESHSRFLGEAPKTKDEAIQLMEDMFAKDFLSFIKPYNSQLDVDDPDNFYMEREWRKYGKMVFTPDDVVAIIVADGFKLPMSEAFPEYSRKVKEI
ncbi:abortive infection system antitoxin AbiGi family protein [Accumulibacter sp.]|uniref:abortive infection system antitoxin AbiGi family protein n=1 Tax=Accumulibacter sp. TaxID=2053492 RepID=UPI0026338F48|nr:abortive infection system antitoxin AbiGi family protein [Accumulibacter sp.]